MAQSFFRFLAQIPIQGYLSINSGAGLGLAVHLLHHADTVGAAECFALVVIPAWIVRRRIMGSGNRAMPNTSQGDLVRNGAERP